MPTMHPVSSQQILDALNWRYAVKKFDAARIIPADTWRTLEESLRLAPSSFGLQPWKFIVVETPALRAQLRGSSWNQPQITDASHLVVLARRTSMDVKEVSRFADRIAEVRAVPRASFQGYIDMMSGWVSKPPPGFDVNAWTSRQVYIALGFFMHSAAMLGVDTCPMEGIDPAAYDRALGLTGTDYATSVVVTAGYRSPADEIAPLKKVRYSPEQVIERR